MLILQKKQGVSLLDVSGATYDNVSFNPFHGAVRGISVKKDDDSKFFVSTNSADRIHGYNMTAGDLSTATNAGPEIATGGTNPQSVYVSPDGKYMFEGGGYTQIAWWELTTGWDLGAVTSGPNYPALPSTPPSGYWWVYFKPDGFRVFSGTNVGAEIYQWDLSTAWNLTTAGPRVDAPPTTITQIVDMKFSGDGKRLFLGSGNGNIIHQYTLDNPWDISSWTKDANTLNVNSVIGGHPLGSFDFNGAETKLYVGHSNNIQASMFQFSL